MKKLAKLLAFFAAMITGVTAMVAADTPVKREMRSTWIATVWQLDWPNSYVGSSASAKPAQIKQQKDAMITMLDSLEINNFNCVYFQVRGFCDAMYKSSYEPWSHNLVTTRGNDPGYDPLEFVIEECHKRGMECHAWLNPYRYESSIGQFNGMAGCYRTEHPDWLIDYDYMVSTTRMTGSILNPGKPEVTQRIVDIISEIVTNYDVDGILFDDYFYPNGIKTNVIEQEYTDYVEAGGSLELGDWRRKNVNDMVQSVFDAIQSIKPYVRFGVGPAGVCATSGAVANSYGVEPCPSGSDWQYDGIYSEPVAWLKAHSIDYISPQVYWTRGYSSADYSLIVPWWSKVVTQFNRHLFVSMSISSLTANSKAEDITTSSIENAIVNAKPLATGPNNTNFTEFVEEVRLNRSSSIDGNPGSVFYSAKYIYKTAKLFGHELRKQVFNTPALVPAMTFKNGTSPGVVKNIVVNGNQITWTGYDNMRYTVYAIPQSVSLDNFDHEVEYLLDFTYEPSYTLPDDKTSGYNYAVCVLDRYGNEYSAAFAGVALKQLSAPALSFPESGVDIEAPFSFAWGAVSGANNYALEIASDASFANVLASSMTTSTSIVSSIIENLPLNQQLYWRVRAMADGCDDGVSEARPFMANMVQITSPEDGDYDVELYPTITWSRSREVTVEISTSINFGTIAYSAQVSGTSHTVEKPLMSNATYYVRLAYEKEGESLYTPVISFKTKYVEVQPTTILYPTEGGYFYGDDVIKAVPAEGARMVVFEVAKTSSFPSRSKLIVTAEPGMSESKMISEISSSFWTEGATYYFRVYVQYVNEVGSIVQTDYSPIVSAIYGGPSAGVDVVQADEIAIVDNILLLGGRYADVKVYNAAGIEMLSVSGDSDVNLSDLSVGVYIVKVATEEKSCVLKHIIK